MKNSNSCTAIICWQNKVLLFLRDDKQGILAPNCWQLPGGGLEPNETPESCIKRELTEEVSHVPANLKFFTKLKMSDKTNVYIFYAFVDNQEASRFRKGEHEGQEVAFFALNEMEKLQLTPTLRNYLKGYGQALSLAISEKSFRNFRIKS
jgi:8-oxo-dGTP diphosphatase